MGRLHIARLCPAPAVLVDRGTGAVVAPRCHRAGGPWARAVGLLGTRRPADGLALWLEPCAAVHTLGMAVTIACAFLDGEGAVLRVVPALPPGRMARCPGARAVVEGTPATLAAVVPGMVLGMVPVRDSSAPSDIP